MCLHACRCVVQHVEAMAIPERLVYQISMWTWSLQSPTKERTQSCTSRQLGEDKVYMYLQTASTSRQLESACTSRQLESTCTSRQLESTCTSRQLESTCTSRQLESTCTSRQLGEGKVRLTLTYLSGGIKESTERLNYLSLSCLPSLSSPPSPPLPLPSPPSPLPCFLFPSLPSLPLPSPLQIPQQDALCHASFFKAA